MGSTEARSPCNCREVLCIYIFMYVCMYVLTVCMYVSTYISKRTWPRSVNVCMLEIILSICNPSDKGKNIYICMYVCMKAWDPREMWCGVDYHPWRL